MNNQLDRDVNLFLSSVAKATRILDFRTFENMANFHSYDPLIANSWTERLLKMIEDCKKAKLSFKEIASLFPNMSQLRCTMVFDLWSAKYSKIDRNDRKKIFQFYNSCLNAYCLEDPLAFKKNIVHKQIQIKNLSKKLKPASPKVAKKLGRLVNACYNLGYAMFSDMNPQSVYENYGPYNYDSGFLAFKEFGNLRPIELWLESKIIPCEHIRICYCYNNNVTMTVNLASHAFYRGDLINNLNRYFLEIDGREYPIDKLDKITDIIEKTAVKIFQIFQSLVFEAYKEKYFFQKAYTYRNIYNKLGQDWEPSEKILSETRGKPLYQANWPKNQNDQNEVIKKHLDPRTNYRI